MFQISLCATTRDDRGIRSRLLFLEVEPNLPRLASNTANPWAMAFLAHIPSSQSSKIAMACQCLQSLLLIRRVRRSLGNFGTPLLFVQNEVCCVRYPRLCCGYVIICCFCCVCWLEGKHKKKGGAPPSSPPPFCLPLFFCTVSRCSKVCRGTMCVRALSLVYVGE